MKIGCMIDYMRLRYAFLGIAVAMLFFSSCVVEEPGDDPEKPDYSEYITDVFEYVYAPGQHAWKVKQEDGDKFKGEPNSDVLLGGFGGYIIAGFNHDVENVEGEPDFEVFSSGVSPEPAVVYVMSDENGDGLPNDTWYELKGSEYGKPNEIRDYRLTYYKPKDTTSNILWKDNQGQSGELVSAYSSTNSSTWWWSGLTGDSIVFKGTRLPDAYVNAGTQDSQNWIVPDTVFTWGYAENNKGSDYSKENRSNQFDISNAIDAQGVPVHLSRIRFIKVQTGVFQRAGWLNEVSSEVKGARDLHYCGACLD